MVCRLVKRKKDNRLRWDDVKYEPGELKVVVYKNGNKWAEDIVKTTDKPAQLLVSADRKVIRADGKDLAFITVKVVDKDGLTVPLSDNLISFTIEGSGEIIATDNGDPSDFIPFPSHERKAFSGLALVIIRSKPGNPGSIRITAKSPNLKEARLTLKSK
jgi:beta-galactosidase